MLSAAKSVFGALGLDAHAAAQSLLAASLDAAAREQGLAALSERLRQIVPSLADQYTAGFDPVEYDRLWERKARHLHAFQISTALDVLAQIGGRGRVVVDIGDSSGNHAAYLKALDPAGRLDKVVSVNLDPVAVDKVRSKGGEAILCRAEDYRPIEGVVPDLYLSFEMLEHLSDPLRFLHSLATVGGAGHLVVSVPYRRNSRFGGDLLRRAASGQPTTPLTAESLHLFELSPEDWALLARLAGWRTQQIRIYRQYPLRHPLAATRPLWAHWDFEGFVALVLRRDPELADRYRSW